MKWLKWITRSDILRRVVAALLTVVAEALGSKRRR